MRVIIFWILTWENCRPVAEPDISSLRWLSFVPRRGSWPTSCSTTSFSPAPASGSPTPTWRRPARKTKWRSWSTVRRSTLRETSPISWRAVTTSRSMLGASSARRNAGPGPSSGSSHTDVLVSHNPDHQLTQLTFWENFPMPSLYHQRLSVYIFFCKKN